MAFIVAAFGDAGSRRAARLALANAGHTVMVFRDGWRALAEVVDGAPDAVVIGARLVGPSCAQFCAALRAFPAMAAIPVVISAAAPTPDLPPGYPVVDAAAGGERLVAAVSAALVRSRAVR